MMWKHATASSLILILLTCTGCSRTNQQSSAATQPNQQTVPASTRYVESVNTVSGSFTVAAFFSKDNKPFTITLTQAYARVVKNRVDPTKKDVVIVLTEKPVAAVALSAVENDDAEQGANDLEEALGNRDVRGVVMRLAFDRKAAAATEEKIRKLEESETEYSETDLRKGGDSEVKPYFKAAAYDMGYGLEVKSFSAEKVEGHINNGHSPDDGSSAQNVDINFTVKLQADAWTGGGFYQQPATKLAPGRASGEFEVDGKPVKLSYAYARLVQYDFFDETKNTIRLWLTENPVEEAAIGDDSANKLLAMKRAGNAVVLVYNTTGPSDRNDVRLWQVKQVPDDTTNLGPMQLHDLNDKVTEIETDYVRFDKNAIEGRLYRRDGRSFFHEYKIDLLFNAVLLPPSVSNGPVTASEDGEALPPDGGAPGKAYLQAIERMRSAKNFDQMIEVWQSVITAELAEKLKRDLPSLTPELRTLFSDALTPIDNPRILGGLVKGPKATLRVAGTARGKKVLEVVNLHLEGGQWKIAGSHTRVE